MKCYISSVCRRGLGMVVGLLVLGLGWTSVSASVRSGSRESRVAGSRARKWAMPREAMPDRCRAIEIEAALLGEAAFTLNLFGGESVRLERDRVVELPGGDRVWSGRIQGEPLSRATFASRGGVVSGVVDRAMSTGNDLYEIEADGAGGHILFQHAENPVSATGDTVEMEGGGDVRRAAPLAVGAVGAVRVIDVMMLYTPASRTRYGQLGIEAKILQAVADANSTMENSRIPARFALVYLGEVGYVETGSMTAALMALQRTTDGLMDEAHALRDQYGADLVTLVDEDTSSCGLSYLMSVPSTGFAANAFSVVYSGCLASLTLVHEWGHNLGCQHDRANAVGPAAYPFAYGWRQCSTNEVMFRTVMSYACGSAIRINYFSNPRLSYAGLPLGVDEATDPANASDNSRAVELNSAIAVDFRPSAVGSVPTSPMGLVAQSVRPTEVMLAWVDTSLLEAVQAVERSADGVDWSLLAVLGKDVTAYADRAVAAGEKWYYRVSAVNGAGASDVSAVLGVDVPLAPAVVVPTVPLAPGSVMTTFSGGQVSVTWVDLSTDETGFSVERSVNGGVPSVVGTVATGVVGFTDVAPPSGTTCVYRVLAVNAVGSSIPTSGPAVIIPETVPVAATGLVAALVGNAVSVSWVDRATNEVSYRLERSVNGGSYLLWVVLNAGTTGYLDTAVVAGSTYSYRVVAANAVGYSPASNTGMVLIPVAVPVAPTGLVGSAVSRSQINLTWVDNSTNETGFRIEQSTNGSTWTQVGTVGTNVRSYAATGLRSATTYYFRVRAFNSGGGSAYTSTVTVKTLR